MNSLAIDLYMEARSGEPTALPRAGSSLEHPLVYDRVARDIRTLADRGLIEIVEVHQGQAFDETVIDKLVFRKLPPALR